MTFDKRHFGLYEGFVKDTADPENKGRIRLTVPQVSGEVSWTNWAPHAGGGVISQTNYPYGTFITTTNQAIAQNAATVVNNWQAEDVNKTYINGTGLYVEETGDYFFQFSAVLSKQNASSGQADIWIRKNGVDIPNSNTTLHLSGSDAEVTVTVGFIVDLDAGDYLQLVASTPDTNVVLRYHSPGTTPTRPAVPGVIATISLIGKYKPQIGQKVWVMYIGGDPNFPVWMGAQT